MTKTNLRFNQIPDSEQKDFIAVCARAHLSPESFEFFMEEEYRSDGGAPITRQASVARISNGKTRHYPAGNGSSWVAAFEDDLSCLYFE